MKRLVGCSLFAALAFACAEAPPLHSPEKPAAPVRPAHNPRWVQTTAPIVSWSGPETLILGQTAQVTARVLLPAGSQVMELQAAGEEGIYRMGILARYPEGATDWGPLDLRIPFTPAEPGVFHLDGDRRYSLIVQRPSGFRRLDPPSGLVWGAISVLPELQGGAVVGNAGVLMRELYAVEGPRSGRVGRRLSFKGYFYTAGDGAVGVDVQELGSQVFVRALVAPEESKATKVPFPRSAVIDFSFIPAERGSYSLRSDEEGQVLTTVKVY